MVLTEGYFFVTGGNSPVSLIDKLETCHHVVKLVSHEVSGLQWKNVGGEKPTTGVELHNDKLSEKLVTKQNFTRDDLEELSVVRFRADDFISVAKSGRVVYFRPNDDAEYVEQTYDPRRMYEKMAQFAAAVARNAAKGAILGSLNLAAFYFEFGLSAPTMAGAWTMVAGAKGAYDYFTQDGNFDKYRVYRFGWQSDQLVPNLPDAAKQVRIESKGIMINGQFLPRVWDSYDTKALEKLVDSSRWINVTGILSKCMKLKDSTLKKVRIRLLDDRRVLCVQVDGHKRFYRNVNTENYQGVRMLSLNRELHFERSVGSDSIPDATDLQSEAPLMNAFQKTKFEESREHLKHLAEQRALERTPTPVRGKDLAVPTLGLKWIKVSKQKPATGTELTNPKLSEALAQKREFTQAEYDNFGIETSLTGNDFIFVQGAYFKPDVSISTDRVLSVDETVVYTSPDGRKRVATVVGVHKDRERPYYTIRISDDPTKQPHAKASSGEDVKAIYEHECACFRKGFKLRVAALVAYDSATSDKRENVSIGTVLSDPETALRAVAPGETRPLSVTQLAENAVVGKTEAEIQTIMTKYQDEIGKRKAGVSYQECNQFLVNNLRLLDMCKMTGFESRSTINSIPRLVHDRINADIMDYAASGKRPKVEGRDFDLCVGHYVLLKELEVVQHSVDKMYSSLHNKMDQVDSHLRRVAAQIYQKKTSIMTIMAEYGEQLTVSEIVDYYD